MRVSGSIFFRFDPDRVSSAMASHFNVLFRKSLAESVDGVHETVSVHRFGLVSLSKPFPVRSEPC